MLVLEYTQAIPSVVAYPSKLSEIDPDFTILPLGVEPPEP